MNECRCKVRFEPFFKKILNINSTLFVFFSFFFKILCRPVMMKIMTKIQKMQVMEMVNSY